MAVSDLGRPVRISSLAALVVFAAMASAHADDLACVSTTFRFVGANDKVCVSAFDDPKVPGIACDISQARTGGVKGSLGLAEDPLFFVLPPDRADHRRSRPVAK